MRRTLFVTLGLLVPLLARANPVIIDPGSLVAFGIVAFAAFVVEAGLVALLLLFRGLAPLRFFGAFFLVNFAVFAGFFQPLLRHEGLPLPVLEAGVVALDGAGLWLLSRLAALQGNAYRGVSWWQAGLTALAGNAASFWVGVVASNKPWESDGGWGQQGA